MMEAPEEWKCHFFHSANKRCRRSEDCTFAHDQDHPTGWEEARKKNLRRPQEEAVRNFGDQCVESPGILKDRTTSIRCWLRGQDVGDVECAASEMHWKMDQSWVQVVFRNTRPVSAAAEAVCLALMSVSSWKCWFREATTGSRFLLRTNLQLAAVRELWHGTTVSAGLAILRDGIKAKRGGDPRGVYGSRSLEDAALSGYNNGCVVQLNVRAMHAASATLKVMKDPCPGIMFKMNRAAISEFVVHPESCNVEALWFPMNILKPLVQEAVSSRPGSVEAAAATSGSVVWAGTENEELRTLQLVQRGSAGATYEFGRADDSGEPELTCVRSTVSSSSGFVEIAG